MRRGVVPSKPGSSRSLPKKIRQEGSQGTRRRFRRPIRMAGGHPGPTREWSTGASAKARTCDCAPASMILPRAALESPKSECSHPARATVLPLATRASGKDARSGAVRPCGNPEAGHSFPAIGTGDAFRNFFTVATPASRSMFESTPEPPQKQGTREGSSVAGGTGADGHGFAAEVRPALH